MLPDAFDRKSPTAARDWRWAWLFPAARQYTHRATGQRRRHHVFDTTVQRGGSVSFRDASRVNTCVPSGCSGSRMLTGTSNSGVKP